MRSPRRRLAAAGSRRWAAVALVPVLPAERRLRAARRGWPRSEGLIHARRDAPHAPRHKRRAPVPVLMYHGVEAPIPGGLPDLFVEPADFRAQMNALARAGATAVTMAQVEAAWTRGLPLPRKPVVLTFDDGYRGQVDNALPVMRRHGWPGVLYMCIANFRPATGLKDKDVRTLLRADWELGAHTFSHSDLRTLAARRAAPRGRRVQDLAGAPLRRPGELLRLPRGHVRPGHRARRPARALPHRGDGGAGPREARPAPGAEPHPGQPRDDHLVRRSCPSCAALGWH